MKRIQDCDFHDGQILSISISNTCVDVLFEKWNGDKVKLFFDDYFAIRDYHSIGQRTSGMIMNSSKEIMDATIDFVLNDGGSEELIGLNSYSFLNSCGDKMIFEIVARNERIDE